MYFENSILRQHCDSDAMISIQAPRGGSMKLALLGAWQTTSSLMGLISVLVNILRKVECLFSNMITLNRQRNGVMRISAMSCSTCYWVGMVDTLSCCKGSVIISLYSSEILTWTDPLYFLTIFLIF